MLTLFSQLQSDMKSEEEKSLMFTSFVQSLLTVVLKMLAGKIQLMNIIRPVGLTSKCFHYVPVSY